MEYEIFNPTYALPYDIVRRIRQAFAHSDDVNDGKDSFYIEIGGKKCEIRVSNHCTYLWTWHERRNGKFDDITRISIVFEDTDTYSDDNLVLRMPRPTPLRVYEFVYRITNPNEFTAQDVTMVIKAIKKAIKSGAFQDPTGKMSYSKERVSVNPKPSGRWDENKDNQINCNKNMNTNRKNIVRLTESQLRNMIKEAVSAIVSKDVEQINDALNNAWNEMTNDEKDCPMWCDLCSDGVAYMTWHKYMDKYITSSDFRYAALVIMKTFDNINEVQSPFWCLSRKQLDGMVKQC